MWQSQIDELVARLEATRTAPQPHERDDDIDDELFALDRQLRDKAAQMALLQVGAAALVVRPARL
jgi:hypothetical protein